MADENKVLKIVYTFFLGLLLAIFVGVGINTFYEGPKPPEWPTSLSTPAKDPEAAPSRDETQYYEAQQAYDKAIKPYNRNVSTIALSAAVILVVVSLVFEKRIKIIADGVMLGGLFTLIYSIIRSFVSEDTKYIFVVVTVGLVLVLYLGYHRFVRSQASKKPDSTNENR